MFISLDMGRTVERRGGKDRGLGKGPVNGCAIVGRERGARLEVQVPAFQDRRLRSRVPVLQASLSELSCRIRTVHLQLPGRPRQPQLQRKREQRRRPRDGRGREAQRRRGADRETPEEEEEAREEARARGRVTWTRICVSRL